MATDAEADDDDDDDGAVLPSGGAAVVTGAPGSLTQPRPGTDADDSDDDAEDDGAFRLIGYGSSR